MGNEYYNPHPYRIVLTNPSGERVIVHGFKRVVLNDNFVVPPNTLKLIKNLPNHLPKQVTKIISRNKPVFKQLPSKAKSAPKLAPKLEVRKEIKLARNKILHKSHRKIVGRSVAGTAGALQYFKDSLKSNNISISNNVGIGILSYNRLGCIKRLLESIRRHTNIGKVTVFVSDESSDQDVKNYLRSQADIVLLDNSQNLGVAGNSNRLLKCLSRFKYNFLLNDDAEILNNGWIDFYINAHKQSGLQHFCHRQYGLIGASENDGAVINKNGIMLQKITQKPHGAVLFFTNDVFSKVGYFDEDLGSYGMEHVDWSNRVGLSGIQEKGYFDVIGSNAYVTVHNEPSKANKSHLRVARDQFSKYSNNDSRIYVNCSNKVLVPSISYVIPIRVYDRARSAKTVINNIRSQLFPNIEIILVEEDVQSIFNYADVNPIKYIFKQSESGKHFNKSKAFNFGVSNSTSDFIILHDADILVQDNYTQKIYNKLNNYDGVHIGKDVIYLTEQFTNKINDECVVSLDGSCEKQVGYFEGGSLACKKSTYCSIGGFNGDFEGYGCEDTEFFSRLSLNSKFFDERTEVFYHLRHGRVGGWEQCHTRNKEIVAQLRGLNKQDYINTLRSRL